MALLWTLDQLSMHWSTWGPIVDAYIADLFQGVTVHHRFVPVEQRSEERQLKKDLRVNHEGFGFSLSDEKKKDRDRPLASLPFHFILCLVAFFFILFLVVLFSLSCFFFMFIFLSIFLIWILLLPIGLSPFLFFSVRRSLAQCPEKLHYARVR